jgi:hypothetical protein
MQLYDTLPSNAHVIVQPVTYIVSPGVYLLREVDYIIPNPDKRWWQFWKAPLVRYKRYLKVAIAARYATLKAGDIILIEE